MILERAKNFINQAESWLVKHDSNYDIRNRMEQIALEIQTTGTYTHNSLELEIGAKLAWFNNGSLLFAINIGAYAFDTMCIGLRF